jgi:hypothetical protein
MNNAYGAIGVTITILLVLMTYVLVSRSKVNRQPIISQAMLHYRYSNRDRYSRRIKVKTQSQEHFNKNNFKVIIVDNQAYWIKDNIFYKAPMVDQSIDKDSAERVDTTDMNKVQLDQMLFILDKLREGINDDSRGSGNT